MFVLESDFAEGWTNTNLARKGIKKAQAPAASFAPKIIFCLLILINCAAAVSALAFVDR